MSTEPTTQKTKAREPRPSIMASNESICGDMSARQLEMLFSDTLRECNKLSTENDLQSSSDKDVVMAKMIRHCIRMLHSNAWVPRTVIRTMVHMEAAIEPDVSVKGMLHQSMREKRDEGRARRAMHNRRSSATGSVGEAGSCGDNTSEQTDSVVIIVDENDNKGDKAVAGDVGAGAIVDSDATNVDDAAAAGNEVSEEVDGSMIEAKKADDGTSKVKDESE